jgi:hypothetical protein
MKLIGWATAAGVAAATTGAMAQPLPPDVIVRPPIAEVSDLDGPYAAMPPPRLRRPMPERGYAPEAYLPDVLSPGEVAAIARDEGFEPLGIPRQRGLVYTLAVINPDGDDGRLVVDARSGRLVRFMPAWQMGDTMEQVTVASYGRIQGLPRFSERNPPRPPRPIAHFASRTPTTPLPRPSPQHPVGTKAAKAATTSAKDVVKPSLDQANDSAKPDGSQQTTAAVQSRPTAVPSAAGPAPTEAKPLTGIKPTEAMPPVQGLE